MDILVPFFMENMNPPDYLRCPTVILVQNEQKRCKSDASSVRAHLFCTRAYFTHNTQQLHTQKTRAKRSNIELPLLCGTCLKMTTTTTTGERLCPLPGKSLAKRCHKQICSKTPNGATSASGFVKTS